jgi:hypothetical protein
VSLPVRRDGEGFSDSLSIDFADPESATAALVLVELRVDAGRARAVEIVLKGDVATVDDSELDADVPSDWDSIELGDLRVSDDGERAAVSLSGEAGELELEATRVAGVTLEAGSPFADATGQIHEAFAVQVTGELRTPAGDARRIDQLGRLVRTSGAPDWARIELIRSLTGVLDDGSLLVMASARPRGAAGHAEEAASAVLLDSEGALTSFEEPLLSTEYDASGAHRRAGLELWAAEEDTAPLRGAGTLVGPSASDFGQLKTAFLRFTLDGAPGTARYDIDTRPAE